MVYQSVTYIGSTWLRETCVLLKLLVELTTWGILEDEVDTRLVIEIAVEPQDVVVPTCKSMYKP